MSWQRSRWCCPVFQSLYESAGRRGLGLLVVDFDGEPAFLLQGRAVDAEHEESLPKSNFPIALASETGLTFCPWCGRHLKRFYRRSWQSLIRADQQPLPM